MPVADLTPDHVLELTGQQVFGVDIADAAEVIARDTGHTVDAHYDTRLISASNVRRAWAIVAVRLRRQTTQVEGITSESDPGYSVSVDLDAADVTADLLHGLPRRLLRLAHGTFTSLGGDVGSHPLWDDIPARGAPGTEYYTLPMMD
jgi:hypothetical protein